MDDPEDDSFPTWAGVVPLELKAGEPLADPKVELAREVPAYIRPYRRFR